MGYNYYCVDCGNEFDRREISFDLADLLGIKVMGEPASRFDNDADIVINRDEKGNFKKFVKRKTTQISVEELLELAKKSKIQLKHNTRSFMKVTLKDFLAVMGRNAGKEKQQSSILEREMRNYKYGKLKEALSQVIGTKENEEVSEKLINEWVSALKARFQFDEDAQTAIMDEAAKNSEASQEYEALLRSNTSNYIAGFWIQPELFDDGRDSAIYTVRYSHDEANANMNDIKEPHKIRGYCPKCSQPVVEGAGKYPHELVGLLGVQSAGKTSLIMAIIKELEKNFEELGIAYPGAPLCDSRYDIMQLNKNLYDKGWAVIKTNAASNEGTFNVTLRLSDSLGKRTKLVTFVDIAGEQCYDIKAKRVNPEAFNTYPVIKHCGLYLLCSCIDKTGYGNADGKNDIIPEDALLQIATEIYNYLPKKDKVPPLCILMTKADMSPAPTNHSSAVNPFKPISEIINNQYSYKNQIDNLKRTYDMTDSEDIRGPLEWCASTYAQMEKKTYISMMSCSALSRSGERYEGDMEAIRPYMINGQESNFRRVRIDVLCKWILEVLGLKTMDNLNYYLSYVPSFDEYYVIDNTTSNTGEHFAATETEMKNRIHSVMRLFINHAELDQKIVNELNKKGGLMPGSKLPERLKKLVNNNNAVYRG